MKIKLSKKRPIKITAGTPGEGPESAQTKVKTILDPKGKENGQQPPGINPNILIETETIKEKKTPPTRVSQPTMVTSGSTRPNVLPKKAGAPNDDGDGNPDEGGSSHGHGRGSHGSGGLNRNPPGERIA